MDWFHTGPERGSRSPAVGPTASSIPFSSVQRVILPCSALLSLGYFCVGSYPLRQREDWINIPHVTSEASRSHWIPEFLLLVGFVDFFFPPKCPRRDSSRHFVPELSPLPHISQALMNPRQWRSVATGGAQAQASTTCTGLSLMHGVEGPEQGFQDLLQHRLGSHVIPARSVPALYLAFGRKVDLKHFYTLQLLPDPTA